VHAAYNASAVGEPHGPANRERWAAARRRAAGWHGDLSALDF
jgi:hypothetical protein